MQRLASALSKPPVVEERRAKALNYLKTITLWKAELLEERILADTGSSDNDGSIKKQNERRQAESDDLKKDAPNTHEDKSTAKICFLAHTRMQEINALYVEIIEANISKWSPIAPSFFACPKLCKGTTFFELMKKHFSRERMALYFKKWTTDKHNLHTYQSKAYYLIREMEGKGDPYTTLREKQNNELRKIANEKKQDALYEEEGYFYGKGLHAILHIQPHQDETTHNSNLDSLHKFSRQVVDKIFPSDDKNKKPTITLEDIDASFNDFFHEQLEQRIQILEKYYNELIACAPDYSEHKQDEAAIQEKKIFLGQEKSSRELITEIEACDIFIKSLQKKLNENKVVILKETTPTEKLQQDIELPTIKITLGPPRPAEKFLRSFSMTQPLKAPSTASNQPATEEKQETENTLRKQGLGGS